MFFAVSSLRHRAAPVLGACALALLAACGGGGWDETVASEAVTVTTSASLAPSASLAEVCTTEGEQAFVRSYLDERYLWWDRIPAVDRSAHADAASYFRALLLRSPDAAGRVADRFSTVLAASDADAMLMASADPAAAVLATGGYALPLVSTVDSAGGRRVGYLLFNKHGRGAQDALIDAVTALRDARIQDLVLDLRHNAGGYLHIAQALASMVAGPAQQGQVFESLRYNDKRAADGAGRTLKFEDTVQVGESRYGKGHPLPQLGLPRLYVLATGMTCSASESIVNGLRGVGIEVVIVGETTCGKPYGFHRKNNCGKAYFAIEFQGVNAAGFGDYAGGFAPRCPVTPDPAAALGDAREPLLAAALHHIDSGRCPAAAKSSPAATVRMAPDALGLQGRLLDDAPQ
ncbi:S41 family peptidase [Ramlibacter rhizophilus]|uniref:Tail specific protease domain-containing protein n=1 Tax=Ramlibacter rhizophilus TaxID=1781167 RepID=A0A4Z0BM93_9BURK|nr:S41 family peptidase [Ramlibacter rhizophilus]TFY99519.1 hypothetical protein EZ242_10200 [Ramlibacter rhizophilus]